MFGCWPSIARNRLVPDLNSPPMKIGAERDMTPLSAARPVQNREPRGPDRMRAQDRQQTGAAGAAPQAAHLPRRFMVLTGKRGGFGAMKPMLRMLRDDAELSLQLVVTDQHVSDRFGRTMREVEREFEIAAAVDLEQANDTALGRAQAMGRCGDRMAKVIDDLGPDICLLYGDRGEVLATAMAATLLDVPIAHIQGGDVSGSLDENFRHAVTKLSHLHFPSIPSSAERIKAMGEEPWRIHVVGDSHLDGILAGDYAPGREVAAKLGLDASRPVFVVLQHSETTEPERAYDQMRETLLAVRDSAQQAVVIYPCSDQGYEGVIAAIKELALPPQFQVHVNLDAPVFWGLLSIASVMVGNSSAGLIETPTFRLPAVNVGRRQEGRLRAENVIDVPHQRAAIAAAIERALHDGEFRAAVASCRQPYGDGHAGKRIVEIVRNTPIDRKLLVKRMTY